MARDLLSLFVDELTKLFEPVTDVVENPQLLPQLLAQIGAESETTGGDALASALSAVASLVEDARQLAATPAPSLSDIARVLAAVGKTFDALRALSHAGGPAQQLEQFGVDLANFLVASYLMRWHPLARQIAALLTLVELEETQEPPPLIVVDGRVVRDAYRIDRFHLSRIADLLRDPVGTLRAAYVTPLLTVADANAMADRLFPRIRDLLRELEVPCRYGFRPGDEPLLGDAAPIVDHALIVWAADQLMGATGEAGVVFTLSAAERGDLGLLASPFGALQIQSQVGPWATELDVSAGIEGVAYGRHGATLLASAGTTQVDAKFTATLAAPDKGPAFVLGSPTASRIEVSGSVLSAQTSLSEARQSLAISAAVSKAAIFILPGDGDGFLQQVLPAGGLHAEFDLGIAWSSEGGLTFHGAAGLEAILPVNLSIGGVVRVPSVYLALRAGDTGVHAEVSTTVALSIGPVQALVDRLGILTKISFPQGGGNLGPLDLAIGFKPPSGIGLSVDAHGVLSGGGFLFHDAAQGLYAGAMQLSLRDQITLKAFGLIATRMPDGSRGYSLIIFITAEDFRPIPLGLGFTLLGIGGMVGVNRTFDENVLRAGLKSGTLATLLFPRDPVGNAPALIRSLASAFPAHRGSYLLGLLAKIGWFTPTLITMDLALIIEFGARQRLLALGRISALLPSADNDLVRLNLEALGVIDFDAGTAAIDAELVDSRLAHKFPITGSAALRAGFGEGPSFVLMVGGCNPHFAAPATVPALNRVAIALSSGDNPRLVCQAYFAITSNTVQFGADASLYARAAGFSVEGNVGFDVLIQLAPLHFIADFHAKLQLKRGSHNLFGVKLNGSLEGPRPLHVSGKATFEILWCDFSVSFDTTLVKGEKPPLPAAVNLLAQLTQALSSPTSWSTQRSVTQTHGVALRSLPPNAPTGPIVLDPLGRVTVKQQVVPLNTARDIDLFGSAPVAGDRRFVVSAALGGTALHTEPLRSDFAPAQFFAMSDDEKLTAPSFESMEAGCVFGDARTSFDPAQIIPAPLEYQYVPITLDGVVSTAPSSAAPAPYQLDVGQLQRFAKSGAAARAPLRRVGRARFRNESVAPAARFSEPEWAIAPNGEGPAATVAAEVRTFSEYQAVVKQLNRGGARFHLVPAHEIEE